MEIPKCHCKVECWCYFDITTYIWHFKCKRVTTTCKDSKKYKIVWKKSYRQPCDFVHTIQIDKPRSGPKAQRLSFPPSKQTIKANPFVGAALSAQETKITPSCLWRDVASAKLELLRLLKNFEIKPDFAHLSELFTHLRKYERTYALVFSCDSQTMNSARFFWKKIDKIKAAVNSLPDKEMLALRSSPEPLVVKQRVPNLIKYLLYKPIEIANPEGGTRTVQRRYPKVHKASALQRISLPIEERIELRKDPERREAQDPELTLEQMEELMGAQEDLFSDGSEDEDCTDKEDSDSDSDKPQRSEESDTSLSESESENLHDSPRKGEVHIDT